MVWLDEFPLLLGWSSLAEPWVLGDFNAGCSTEFFFDGYGRGALIFGFLDFG